MLFTKDKYYPLLQELTYIRPLRMLSPAMFASGISTDPMTENSCHAGWGSITGNGETLTCAGVRGVSGTGPFKFVETLPNGDVRFDKHADYWRGEPQISQIIVTISPLGVVFSISRLYKTQEGIKRTIYVKVLRGV